MHDRRRLKSEIKQLRNNYVLFLAKANMMVYATFVWFRFASLLNKRVRVDEQFSQMQGSCRNEIVAMRS